jgi:hypothetical protein
MKHGFSPSRVSEEPAPVRPPGLNGSKSFEKTGGVGLAGSAEAMFVFRRIQSPVIAVLLVLLASPAVAACCVWTGTPMVCCEKSDVAGLAAGCCMNRTDQSQQQVPASVVKLSRQDSGLLVAAVAQPIASIAAARAETRVEQPAGPPGSDPLYLRLSVIRR